MPRLLDPITADRFFAGQIAASLKIAKRSLRDPDGSSGRLRVSADVNRALWTARQQIFDAVDGGADINATESHAEAIVHALNLTGVMERLAAINHLWRVGNPDADELVRVVHQQITDAIRRLTEECYPSEISSCTASKRS
jgi:hypothetical protein